MKKEEPTLGDVINFTWSTIAVIIQIGLLIWCIHGFVDSNNFSKQTKTDYSEYYSY